MSLKQNRQELDEVAQRLYRLGSSKPGFDQAERAAFAREAHAVVNAAARLRQAPFLGREALALWYKAADRFHAAIRDAYPPGFWTEIQRLRGGDLGGLETAVAFLEADPWFFRSGYVKEMLIWLVRRVELPREYAARLEKVVLAVVDGRDRREFRNFCRLARKVDTPELRGQLLHRLKNEDPRVRRHAAGVLAACERTDGRGNTLSC
jgi:hypothetical protein